MEIRQLRAIVAIAETHTFTAAAERVHVTQAAISMQIRQLELETGTLLFVRTPRRCVLTHAGERLLERARRILREHDDALAELGELSGTAHGRLRLGSSSSMFSSDQLPRILKILRTRCENVEVTVTSGTSETLVKGIVAGDLDIAFVSLPVEARGVQTELLLKDELIAIANPEHPLAHKRVISAFELAGQKLILGERGGNTRRLIDQFFAEAGLRPVVAMELSRLTSIKRMVEAGMGIGIVPVRSALEEIAAGSLVRWWIEGAQINSELGFAYLTGGYQSNVTQTFISICRENLEAESETMPKPHKQGVRTSRQIKAKPKRL